MEGEVPGGRGISHTLPTSCYPQIKSPTAPFPYEIILRESGSCTKEQVGWVERGRDGRLSESRSSGKEQIVPVKKIFEVCPWEVQRPLHRDLVS